MNWRKLPDQKQIRSRTDYKQKWVCNAYNYLLCHEIQDAQELLPDLEPHHFLANQEILENLVDQLGLVDQEVQRWHHEIGNDRNAETFCP